MSTAGLPIWGDSVMMLVSIETAARHLPRYHKYILGTEMRQQGMKICQLVNRAWRDKQNVLIHLQRLVFAVDDLKLQLQVTKEIEVFSDFATFEHLAHQARGSGKQSGGWVHRLQSAQPEASPISMLSSCGLLLPVTGGTSNMRVVTA